MSCLLLGPTKLPVVTGVLFVGEQQPGPELPSSGEVKNKRMYIHLMAWAGKHYTSPVRFKDCKSMYYHTIQINQLTKCNCFTSLLLDVYLQLNMFRAS